jgi:uncharacterized membrane-anchored protein
MIRIIDRLLDHITIYRLVLYYLAALLGGAFVLGFFSLVPHDPMALSFSVVVILAACWISNWVFARVFGVPLQTTLIACVVVLAAVFAAWYATEKTLSIHTVVTTRREVFYWLAVLGTFALGTAAGDYVAETLGVGYLTTGFIFGGVIAAVAVAYYVLKVNGILAFWLAYVFTRPLGASPA